jgi:glycosyltransferase involved in cell wall biosynthesis
VKVLMVGAYPVVPGVVNGGVESATATLVSALADCDDIDSVTVLRFHQGEAPVSYRRQGTKVEVHYLRGQNRLRTLTGSFLDVRKARKFAADLRPDVVHGQEIGWNGDIAAKCSRDAVITVHGMVHVESRMAAGTSLRQRLRVKPIERMVARVLRRAKVVISISDYDAAELRGLVRGTRVSIANPIDPGFFALAPSGPTPPRVMFAGVYRPLKNLTGIVHAFARAREVVPEARLSLIGPQPDADYVRQVRDLVTALGLSDCVDITGLVGTEELQHELAQSRAVVLFSHQEVAPTIIAQAMAAGKPVVASRVGGVGEMVTDGETGYLVDAGDEAALAERLIRLLADQQLATELGRRGHDVALHRYAPAAIARRTVDVYRQVLNA